jgi:hypothetical protein
MLKIGDKVEHVEYGKGEVTSINKEREDVWVAFEQEHEVLTGEVIDTDHYFEDNREVEKTRFIMVGEKSLTRVYQNHCWDCGGKLTHQTHNFCSKCDYLKCDCGSCMCNKPKSVEGITRF